MQSKEKGIGYTFSYPFTLCSLCVCMCVFLCVCMCVCEPTSPPALLCKTDFFFFYQLFICFAVHFCVYVTVSNYGKRGGGGGLNEPDCLLMTPSKSPTDNELTQHELLFSSVIR